jgi:hypothetical protein
VCDSMDNLDHRGSTGGSSCELLARVRAKVRAKIRTKDLGEAACAVIALLVVLKFFVPGHLDRFELSFV